MPATPSRRPRLAASLVAAVLGIGLLAGCAGQQAPGDYSGSVERNFLSGCTTTAEGDEATFDVAGYCGCVYDELSNDETGVDFDEFKKVNDDQIEEPSELPESFTKIYDRCAEEFLGEGTSSETSTDETTTTTEG